MTDNKAGSVIKAAKTEAETGANFARYKDITAKIAKKEPVSAADKQFVKDFKKTMMEAYGSARSFEGMKKGGKVKKYMGGGKVYTTQNKRYAHGGKVSGRKAKYNG